MAKGDSNGKPQARLTGRTLGRPEGVTGDMTRERILEVAAVLFAERGLRDVSLAEIAGAAGLTAPAIYHHFASKDDLFIAAVCGIHEQIVEAFEEAESGGGAWQERLMRLTGACREIYREDGVLQRIGLRASLELARDPDRFQDIADSYGPLDRVFERIARDAIAKGDVPERFDPKVVGDLLRSMLMNATASNMLLDRSAERFANLMDAFDALVLPGTPRLQLVEDRPA